MIIPAFVTPYIDNGTFGIALITNKEDMLTILPLLFLSINGSTAFVILKVQNRFVLISRFHCSSVIKWNGVGSLIIPALFTRMSTVSNLDIVCSAALITSPSLVRSAFIARTFFFS